MTAYMSCKRYPRARRSAGFLGQSGWICEKWLETTKVILMATEPVPCVHWILLMIWVRLDLAQYIFDYWKLCCLQLEWLVLEWECFYWVSKQRFTEVFQDGHVPNTAWQCYCSEMSGICQKLVMPTAFWARFFWCPFSDVLPWGNLLFIHFFNPLITSLVPGTSKCWVPWLRRCYEYAEDPCLVCDEMIFGE